MKGHCVRIGVVRDREQTHICLLIVVCGIVGSCQVAVVEWSGHRRHQSEIGVIECEGR